MPPKFMIGDLIEVTRHAFPVNGATVHKGDRGIITNVWLEEDLSNTYSVQFSTGTWFFGEHRNLLKLVN